MAFKVTKETAKKIVANPKTPPQLRAFYAKKFKLTMKGGKK
jgi:hypothetical protein